MKLQFSILVFSPEVYIAAERIAVLFSKLLSVILEFSPTTLSVPPSCPETLLLVKLELVTCPVP